MISMPMAVAHASVAHASVAHTNYTAIIISVGIIFIVGVVIAVVVASYYRLQRHRADAVAMAAYRKLAEDAVANQQELRAQLAQLTEHVRAVEQLMRDVG
jgi:heme/copper-type cytochrome/quinol oxidase subunit 2